MKNLWLFAAMLAPGHALLAENPRAAVVLPSSGLRIMALERNDQDATSWSAIRNLGANAVVTKDVPPHTVAVGSPARVVKDLRGDSADAARTRLHVMQHR